MNKSIYQSELLFPKILWQRPVHYYKSEAGKILVLAGSKGASGIAMLVCEAIFRSGTGVLLLGLPKSLQADLSGILPEAMTLTLPETPAHSLAKTAKLLILENANSCDVAVIGPGLSANAETIQLIWELIFELHKPIVLCGDGIHAFIKGIEVMRAHESETFMYDYLAKKHAEMIIVLSPSEAAKLSAALRIDEQQTAETLAQKLNCSVVTMGPDITLVDNTAKSIITPQKGSKHATNDFNDILSGIIGSFVGQNPDRHLEATATAIYLYSQSKEVASSQVTNRAVAASDIVRYLPQAIKKAEE